jgi:hypothetical protein
MIAKKLQNDRLIVLFLAGVLVMNYPLLAMSDRSFSWLGIPVLYLYLFGSWFAFIILLATTLSSRSRTKPSAQFPKVEKKK